MIALTIDGDTRVIKGLEEAIRKVGSPEPALRNIGEVLVTEFQANFPEEGARLNDPWAELKEDTRRQKIAMGYGDVPTLVRTGALLQGFESDVNRFRVRVSNPVSYFRYHQLGEGRNPQRRMILFPERLKQEVMAQFTLFIHEALSGL